MLNFDRNGLHALRRQGLLQIFAPELAVVGRIGKNRDFLEAALRDGFFDDHRRLNAVGGRIAEHVVIRLIVELLRHHRAGRDVVEHGNLRFLEKALRRKRHAGVDITDDRDDLLLVDELLRDLHAALVLRFVITLDEHDLTAKHAARLVDFRRGETHAVAHADTHGRRTARERTIDADLDRIRRVRQRKNAERERARDELHLHTHVCLRRFESLIVI